MSRTYILRWAIAFAFLLCCGGVFGQTFTINSRSTPGGDTLFLDQTLTVTYNVSSTGSERVVPVLRTADAALADSVSVTWQGTAATNSLSNLTFKIHLYNDANLCSTTIPFELLFFSEDFAGSRAASPSSTLQFGTTGGGQVTLTDLIVETQGLPWPLSTASATTHLLGTHGVAPSVISDPTNRIFLWADYNLDNHLWSEQWIFFLYQLNQENCVLSTTRDINTLPNITANVIDTTGPTPVTVTQAPLGGAGTGMTLGQGVNIFDVTDISLSGTTGCSSTVRDSIDYSSGLSSLLWRYDGIDVVVRRFALYVGTVGGCIALVENFGMPPAAGEFQVDDFFLSSLGDVNASLIVPAAWMSGGQLSDDYRVQWYLRTDGYMASLGGATRSLELDGSVSRTIDNPADYYLEARIHRTDNASQVSITSRDYNHNLDYTVASPTFLRAEQIAISGTNADGYLDPGEIANVGITVTSLAGGTLPALETDHGLVIDDNGNDVIDDGDIFLDVDTITPGGVNIRFQTLQQSGSGSSRELTLPFELLTTEGTGTVWFYVDVDYESDGVATTYRRYTPQLELNAQISSEPFFFDFALGAGTDWDVTNTTSTPNSGEWAYSDGEHKWVGIGGGDVDNADDLYRLKSPIFPLGDDGHVEFNHLPDFTFNQSAGMMEYRTRVGGGTWTGWINFVEAFCSECDYYNNSPFPTTPTSYFGGQYVWMSNDGGGLPSLVGVDLPTILGRDEIQFRFVFGDPSLVDTGRSSGDTNWRLDNFTYQATLLGEDNLFGIDLAQLTQDACEEPTLAFLGWAPIATSQLTFEWYESLNDLYNDVSTGDVSGVLGSAVPFTPVINGTYTYFVRIKYLGTERVLPFIVEKVMTCSTTPSCFTPEEALDLIHADVAANWPGVKNITDCVSIVNLICE